MTRPTVIRPAKAGAKAAKSKAAKAQALSEPVAREVVQARAPEAPPLELAQYVESLAVGHQPVAPLAPQDEKLFRAFQSNLLSLISHELRTPLTGILNALGLLEEGSLGDFSSEELVVMARQNAQRLHRTLLSLLDLAALESGTFHARLREVELFKLVSGRIEAHQSLLKDRGLPLRKTQSPGSPVLADPQKFSRALDLCFQILIPRVEPSSPVKVRISSASVAFEFSLATGLESTWEGAWSQALTGFQSGVAAPTSAFAGVLQSEQAFLSRMEEGLGSEFLIVHEIMRQHRGKFTSARKGRAVSLSLELPELSSEEALRAVLSSRAYEASSELRSVTLVLLALPEKADPVVLGRKLRPCLFRASDALYVLPEQKRVAVVLDDCKPEYLPPLLKRLEQAAGEPMRAGVAHCPTDGHDPMRLLELARKRVLSHQQGK